MRRLRRRPESEHDPRYEKDGYWALRLQGYSHSYAKRAFRDEPPKVVKQEAVPVADCDPDDILFPPGSTFTKIEVAVRPPLTEDAVANALPRMSEYTIWDHKISGFGLRVRPSGYKCFVLYCWPGGRLKKITLGRAGNWTLEDARQAAREYLHRLHNEASAIAQSLSADDAETE